MSLQHAWHYFQPKHIHIYLLSPRKHMLWVLIRSASSSNEYPQICSRGELRKIFVWYTIISRGMNAYQCMLTTLFSLTHEGLLETNNPWIRRWIYQCSTRVWFCGCFKNSVAFRIQWKHYSVSFFYLATVIKTRVIQRYSIKHPIACVML